MNRRKKMHHETVYGKPMCHLCEECYRERSKKHNGCTYFCQLTGNDVGASRIAWNSPKNCPKRNNQKSEEKSMNSCIKSDVCMDSAKYAELITGEKQKKNPTLNEWESMKNPDSLALGCSEYYSGDFFNYPLTEIEEIIDAGTKVVLVRFPKENEAEGFDYRFGEIPEEVSLNED